MGTMARVPVPSDRSMQIDAETLGDLVDDVPDAVVLVDADRLIHYANPTVRDVFG